MIRGLLDGIIVVGIEVLVWLMIIRVFLSWIPHNPYNPILRFIYDMTDPMLNFVGRYMPDSLRMPLDSTPIVVLIGLQCLVGPLLRAIVRMLPF